MAGSASDRLAAGITRRDCLAAGLAAAGPAWLAASSGRVAAQLPPAAVKKKVAGVVTVYTHNSHADVILSKILSGWRHQGGPGPQLELTGLYVDQFPKGDLARQISQRHGVPIYDSIAAALTNDSAAMTVDGVLSIGEHGSYPTNRLGQRLYPRRRFFEQIAATMEKHQRVAPVFSDKHLGPRWTDARWMYDLARQLKIPLMAGSSLPVTFRRNGSTPLIGSDLQELLVIGYGGIESYGFHALESLQAFAERRKNAETGVEWVQCVSAADLWKAVDRGEISAELLAAAAEVVPRRSGVTNPRDGVTNNSALFRIGYRDGLQASVFMLNGFATGMAVAGRGANVFATELELRTEPRYPHFAYLLKAIETMMLSGQPAYPVERTLLTSGLLDRLLTSRDRGRRLATPELAIEYRPADYPWAPQPPL